MSVTPRPPFDPRDAEQAEAFLRKRGLASVDPFAGPNATDDLIFKASLSGVRSVMEQCFKSVRADGRTFRVYPLIVEKPSANAFAVDHAGLQLCGLDIGLGNAVFEIGMFVFSQSSLFREIGNTDRERSPNLPPGSQLAFWIADQLRERGTPDGAPIGTELMPCDPLRQQAVDVLTQLMLRFVWLHELYHGLNGHTGLLASMRSEAVLNEMPDDILSAIEVESEEDAERDEQLRHSMEYDADRSALWMLVRMLQVDFEPLPGLLAWPKPLRLKLSLFSAVMMTFLFDQAARRRARQSTATHPTAQYRLMDLVRTVASHLAEPAGDMKQAFSAVLAEMTALHARLPQFVAGSQLLDDLRSVGIQRQLDEVDDALTVARTSFSLFAYR